MAKNLLNEVTVRKWGKLAQIAPLTENFIEERADQFNESDEQLEEGSEETLEEDNYDKTGPGPHREGTGKNNHSGESGVAQNQGKEVKDSPDGKLEIPGTGYAGEHKNKSKSPEKGSTDGGTQLQGKGNVTENRLNEMPDMDDEMEDGLGDEMEDDLPPPPMGDESPMGGEVDLEKLVGAIAKAISQETGVEISVAGHAEPDGDEGMPPMGDEPPMGAEPPVDDIPPSVDSEEDEEIVEKSAVDLTEVDDATFQAEATRRGYSMQESDRMRREGVYKKDDEDYKTQQEAMVESIAKKVAAKLSSKKK